MKSAILGNSWSNVRAQKSKITVALGRVFTPMSRTPTGDAGTSENDIVVKKMTTDKAKPAVRKPTKYLQKRISTVVLNGLSGLKKKPQRKEVSTKRTRDGQRNQPVGGAAKFSGA